MTLILAGLLLFIAFPAKEFIRHIEDLDADGSDEVISMSSSGDGDFADFQVTVGETFYSDKYFAVEGDKPSTRIVRLDYKVPSRQLLVEVAQASSCDFHLLAFYERRILPLLVIRSPTCYSPEILGDGKVRVASWEGFWKRVDTYALDPTGGSLSLQPTLQYPIGVTGITATALTLGQQKCRQTKVPVGGKIRIELFDETRKRFFVSGTAGVCGWLGEQDIGKISGLPWAN